MNVYLVRDAFSQVLRKGSSTLDELRAMPHKHNQKTEEKERKKNYNFLGQCNNERQIKIGLTKREINNTYRTILPTNHHQKEEVV